MTANLRSSRQERFILTRTAYVTLSGHRIVVPRTDGTVDYASNANPSDLCGPFWLTMGAAVQGTTVELCAYGEVVEPSWAWTPRALVYLGLDGLLTQVEPTSPSADFLAPIGTATNATSLLFDPTIPFVLGENAGYFGSFSDGFGGTESTDGFGDFGDGFGLLTPDDPGFGSYEGGF